MDNFKSTVSVEKGVESEGFIILHKRNIFKLKSSRFKEISQKGKGVTPVNMNRMQSAVSKLGPGVGAEAIITEMTADVKEEFGEGDFEDDIRNLVEGCDLLWL